MISTNIGLWIGSIFIILVFTYFISNKQNVFFRFAQTTLVGISLGYIVVLVMIKTIDSTVIFNLAKGNWIYIIPFIIGLMGYSKFIKGYEYLGRAPISIIVAVAFGLGGRGAFEIVRAQIAASANKLILGVDVGTAFNNLIFIIAITTTMGYFYFTMTPKQEKTVKPFIQIGRIFLMIFIGQRFGGAIMSRLSLFLGQMEYIIWNLLGLR